jgi:L,D-peptidoglycan transpeptidase YkuD (ErfK/YbiS/YcfS/YnhG family)
MTGTTAYQVGAELKKRSATSLSAKLTLSANFRQKPNILHPRGPIFFSHISVRALPRLANRPPRGILSMGSLSFPCAIGRAGIGVKRREGDGLSPMGRFAITAWLRRKDQWRVFRPDCIAIEPTDGWCDDPASQNYNRPVSLPSRAGAENLWREDNIYDVVGILDFNFRPRILWRGSAIFVHLAHPDLRPTAGCIAIPRSAMQKAQLLWPPGLQVCIGEASARPRAPKIAEPTRT